jgi:DNA primase
MRLDDFAKRANQIILEYDEPRRYLYGRGLTDEDIAKFEIGYVRVAKIKKDDSEDYKSICQATYEFKGLQNRIIFPLKNILGRVHGLCTRDLNQKRYTQYFLGEAKSIGAFFGLYEALPHIRKTRKVFVHEGAFDSISFSRVFPNSVSSLTSFLNEQQFELLRFYADKIILVYDKDSAGSTGIQKSMQAYGERYLDQLYIGVDDSNKYLQILGPERFERYVRSKVSFFHQS